MSFEKELQQQLKQSPQQRTEHKLAILDHDSSLSSLNISFKNYEIMREGDNKRRNLMMDYAKVQSINQQDEDSMQLDEESQQFNDTTKIQADQTLINGNALLPIMKEANGGDSKGIQKNTSTTTEIFRSVPESKVSDIVEKQVSQSKNLRKDSFEEAQQNKCLLNLHSLSNQSRPQNQKLLPNESTNFPLKKYFQIEELDRKESENYQNTPNTIFKSMRQYSEDIIIKDRQQEQMIPIREIDIINCQSDNQNKLMQNSSFSHVSRITEYKKKWKNYPLLRLRNNGESRMSSIYKLQLQEREDSTQEKKLVSILNLKFFKRTQLISRFLNNLKSKTSAYLFRHISASQYHFLDDKSGDFSYYQQKGILFEQKLSRWEHFITYIKNWQETLLTSENYIIQPESILFLVWQIMLILIYLFLIFFIPIYDNFKPPILSAISYIHLYPLFVIPIDTFFKLNTAVYNRGIISKKRDAILKKYLHNDAKLDIIIFAIYLISQTSAYLQILSYVMTAKIRDVIKIIRSIFQRYDQKFKQTTLLRIITLIVIILTFLHTQAAIFVKIGLDQIQASNQNWIQTLLPADYTQFSIYIHSFYWSIITMTTIGYGDIHPVSQIELIYVSIVSLISCGIYGYSLSQIGQILNEIQQNNERHSKQMQILNSMMNQRQLDKSMQNQVRQYFEYLNKHEQQSDEKAMTLIQQLPNAMRNNILFDINYKILIRQKLFSLNFSKEFLNKLTLEMKIMNLGPDIEVYSEGQVDEKIYFITKGEVEISVILGSKQKSCFTLQKGDMFGELEFFTKEVRKITASTVGVVSISYIEFKDFMKCIQSFQGDLETLYSLKDKANLYNSISLLGIQCKGCLKYSHTFLKCPYLNFTSNTHKIIHESQKSEDQKRNEHFQRLAKKRINAYDLVLLSNPEDQECFYQEQEEYYYDNSQMQTQGLLQRSAISQQLFNLQQQQSIKNLSDIENGNNMPQLLENEMNNQFLDSPLQLSNKRKLTMGDSDSLKKNQQFFRPNHKRFSQKSQKQATESRHSKKSQTTVKQNLNKEDQYVSPKRSPTCIDNLTHDMISVSYQQQQQQLQQQSPTLLLQQQQQQYSYQQIYQPQQQQSQYTQNSPTTFLVSGINHNSNTFNPTSLKNFNLNQNQIAFSPILQKRSAQRRQTINSQKYQQPEHLSQSENIQLIDDNTFSMLGDKNNQQLYSAYEELPQIYHIIVGFEENNIRYYINQSDFDTFRNYKMYFPHNNITNILNKTFYKTLNLQNTLKNNKKQKKFITYS